MEETDISCPFCGENINILIDCSVAEQQYVEDCQVCCSPIVIAVTINSDQQVQDISVSQENE